MSKKLYDTAPVAEKAILVAVQPKKQSDRLTDDYLNELEFLAGTAGVQTIARFSQKVESPDIKYFVGKGKLQEVEAMAVAEKVDMVIFDDELTPSQVRNLENVLKCKILDRPLLILNIFSLRAKTSQAKAQVELAQYQYLLPRLTRMWTHLSKQKGGVGMRGPGEKELETDRRIVRDKIALLRKKLDKIDKQSETQRKGRSNMVRVSLVGYTNVGKSTLMRKLSKSDVFAENKLFATVDSTVRKVTIGNIPFLLTDTVGFIRKLPTTLVESFKSTLDEITEADILLHVVDVAHPSSEDHEAVVLDTLSDIKASDKKIITVYNKVDLLDLSEKPPKEDWQIDNVEEEEETPLEKIQRLKEKVPHSVFISAESGDNMPQLKQMLFDEVMNEHMKIYPNYLKPEYLVFDRVEEEEESDNSENENDL
ncbi:MAG: GTPase HflX [Cyclobacteriaceae bacterium]|nr:GTPase HflX [Cyclobacteriaceae bacterium]MCH8515053.1 GTPase HflX [Cyclobacteriaceae bacterium]